ncbi:hypothetical protein [Micromonospora sp. U21]|uniref:hypothetical protein n=1 Tax=Micromonospora sp. U21 TaxID=2824899 RepID=UPI001B3700A1|nr:hypothetical protein [Micromonospora sp. U21]MBQ0901310.1 hypothetical protein [Micromonospora sp. U21]
MISRFSEADFQLVWPRKLFKAQAAKLLNQRARDSWNENVEMMLEHAFAGGYAGGPAAEFRDTIDGDHTWGSPPSKASSLTARQQFLRNLLSNADQLHEDGSWRRPYWRERKAGQRHSAVLSETAAIREFVHLVNELDGAGYFENRFGKDCVDDPRDDSADALFERELGVKQVWPLNQTTLGGDIDLFFDVVELLHDHVSLPTTRRLHNYAGCGWHHVTFEAEPGRMVYRWRVNKILVRSDFGLRLADEGDDVGRLVSVTDDARTELMHAVASRKDSGPADQVRHALALFRQRGADRNQKRSAIAALALVLEERRHSVLADALAKSDRGALFDIANNFHVRHQDAKQKRDYDDFYLDWIFWTYLATVELTNRIVDSQGT